MSQNLRILFVVANSMLNRDMPTGLENLALQLHGGHRKVTILAGGQNPSDGGKYYQERCTYIWSGRGGRDPAAFLRRVDEIKDEEFPDVIIGWVSSIALIAQKYSCKTICIGHNGQMPPRSFLLRIMKGALSGDMSIGSALTSWFAFRRARNNLHYFVGNSEAVRSAWVKKLRFSSSRSSAIKRGIDLSFYTPSNAPRRDFSEPTIIFVGRPSKHKGFFDLIEALRMIETPIKLKVFGEVTDVEHRRLEGLLKAVSFNVSFGGILESKDLRREYWAADIFVLPSVSEGMPKALLEAMGCGLCVVCSDISPHKEIIQDEVNGFLHRTRCPNDLMLKIKGVIEQKKWTLEMKRRALTTVHEFHDIEIEVNAWVALLEEKFGVLADER